MHPVESHRIAVAQRVFLSLSPTLVPVCEDLGISIITRHILSINPSYLLAGLLV